VGIVTACSVVVLGEGGREGGECVSVCPGDVLDGTALRRLLSNVS
jgi:NAD-dependent dihydropyrimidine dehydrogenase PreA subunit